MESATGHLLKLYEENIKQEIKEENFSEIFNGQQDLVFGSVDILDVHENNNNILHSKELLKDETDSLYSCDFEENGGFQGFHMPEVITKKDIFKKRQIQRADFDTGWITIKSCKIDTSLQFFLERIKFLKNQSFSFYNKSTAENFKCLFCTQTYSDKRRLKLHLRSHPYYRPYQCSECGVSFGRKSELESHELTHLKITLFRCSTCSRVFRRRYFLIQHQKSHLKPKVPVTCPICLKKLRSKCYLKIHLGFHTENRNFTCDICGKAYATSVQLQSHAIVHSQDTPFSCADCGSSFKRKQSLTYHVRTHFNIRPYSCDLCEKTFRVEQGLKKHVRIHSKNENQLVCSICKKKLKTKQSLIIHHRQHSGTKPFRCDRCGKCFRQQPHLRTHERSVHSTLKRFRCSIPFCGRAFHQRSHLTTHLDAHFNVRRHKCDCGKACATKAHLVSHQRTHTGERPYGCHTCGQAFSQRSSLITHVRSDKCDRN